MIIIARNFGQLGNRLLLSAHLIAAAREYGVTLVNPSFAEYARYFPSTAGDLWCRYPAADPPVATTSRGSPGDWRRRVTYKGIYLAGKTLWTAKRLGCPARMIRLKGEETCDLASEEFKQLAQSSIPLLVSGWQFRSVPLLEKHADEVRAHYQILPRHRAAVRQLMSSMRARSELIVGVHIRGGDYATFENGRYFYTPAQYADAMRRVKQQLGDREVTFLVCGNARLDADDFQGLDVRFGTGHLIEDMYTFAETDFLIGPPSTYTGWAAFYGRVPLQFMHTADQPLDASSIHPRPAEVQAA